MQENTALEADFIRLLQQQNNAQLVTLLRELLKRYPALLPEITHLLHAEPHAKEPLTSDDSGDELDEELTEDWDFSSVEVPQDTTIAASVPSLDINRYRLRLAADSSHRAEDPSATELQHDLREIYDEAETCKELHDLPGALALYELLIDARLSSTEDTLQTIFDAQLDNALPTLEMLLSEASSSVQFTPAQSMVTLLSREQRQGWLERLFALWLTRIEQHSVGERLQLMLHTIAWSEDTALLHRLTQQELHQHSTHEYTNIVDFQQLHRIRLLERFLRTLPAK